MRSTSVLLTAAAALAAASITAAARPDAGPAQAGAPTGTLELLEREGRARFVDHPPVGGRRRPPSLGDELVITGVDRDPATGARAGRSSMTCTLLGASGLDCRGTLVLRDGQIAVQGVAGDAPPATVAVVGGTGRYAGARGTMTVTEAGDRERVVISFLP